MLNNIMDKVKKFERILKKPDIVEYDLMNDDAPIMVISTYGHDQLLTSATKKH